MSNTGIKHPIAITAYVCGECGLIHHSKGADSYEAAQTSAERCCAPKECPCGAEIYKPWTKCESCREQTMLRKAEVIIDYTGPVCYGDGGGTWGDGYSGSVQELIEWYKGEGLIPPTYCHPCTSELVQLDPWGLLEMVVEEKHEDAVDEIVDADALIDFIHAWNAKQTCRTYYEDKSKVIVLDPVKFNDILTG